MCGLGLLERGRQDSLIRPIFMGIDTLKQSFSRNTNDAAPFRYGMRHTVHRQMMIAPRIIHLFALSRPTAIIRFIVTVVVDAIKRMLFGGTFAHILKKVFKRLHPSVTNQDASAPVVRVDGFCGIVAPLFHFAPNIMGARVRLAVFVLFGGHYFFAQTSTTARMSRCQVGRTDLRNRAANTFAPPSPRALSTFSEAQDRPTEEGLSRMIRAHRIWQWLENDSIFGVRHLIQSSILNYLARAVGCLRTLRPTLIIAQ